MGFLCKYIDIGTNIGMENILLSAKILPWNIYWYWQKYWHGKYIGIG